MTETSSSSINFKNRCMLGDVYSRFLVTIFHVNAFHGNNGDFPVHYPVIPFEKQKHYFVVNLIAVVHLTKDCCASNIKLYEF